jgi:NAD(P)H dehydrogenase (quinone)
MTTIGITGAAGQLGRRTVDYVLRSHPAQELVLFSRTPSALSGLSGVSGDAGVATRFVDFDQPHTLTGAFDGVEVLLLISTDAVGRRRTQHEAAISAAADAGVGRIVYTSMPNADADFPARARPLADDHAATELALRKAGPAWTVLRNALYFEAISGGWPQAVAGGALATNNGDGRHAPVARDDCAAAAAAVLLGDGHDGVAYDIAGPRLLDDRAIADALTQRHGRRVDVVGVSDEAYRDALVDNGLPAEMAELLTGFGESIRAGLLETPLGDVETLTGRPPVAIAEFLAGDAAG